VAKSLLQDERVNGQEALNRIQVGCEKECWGGKANGETVGGFHGISISIKVYIYNDIQKYIMIYI